MICTIVYITSIVVKSMQLVGRNLSLFLEEFECSISYDH